jgi:hypothetical protein
MQKLEAKRLTTEAHGESLENIIPKKLLQENS